jgi:hypothetical protein
VALRKLKGKEEMGHQETSVAILWLVKKKKERRNK